MTGRTGGRYSGSILYTKGISKLKTKKYDFQWFEKEDGRRSMRASVSTDGKLRLGRGICAVLPPWIRVGFDTGTKTLAVADGHGAGIDWPVNGVVSALRLSREISGTGLTLPVSFLLERDEASGYWLGQPVLRRHRTADGLAYDQEQALFLYGYVVDQAVCRMAKSTPAPERRSIAMAAFLEAVRAYRPGFGDLETYLAQRVQRELLVENKNEVKAYRDRSLEQPFRSGDGSSGCLYDILPGSMDGGIAAVEEKIALEEFQRTLSQEEREILRMSGEGYLVAEISGRLRLDEAGVLRLGAEIGRKRRAFEQGEM